jgi:hypothetical protein
MQNVTISTIKTDANLKGILKGFSTNFSASGLIIKGINEYNELKPTDSVSSLTLFEDVFYFTGSSEIMLMDSTIASSFINKGSVFNLRGTKLRIISSKLR